MKKPEIDGYRLDKKLGESEFSSIYSAIQVSLDRTVALKVLKPEHESNSAAVAKFKLQTNAVNELRHACIPQVFHSSESHGHHYCARELVEGMHIGEKVRRHRGMGEDNALLAIENIAAALEHAWKENELVHANLKPQNVLIDKSGSIKLVDFSGLTASASVTLRRALSGVQIGHPAYSAPEAVREQAALDFRSDIYSLGALYYFLLTEREPFGKQQHNKIPLAHDSDFLPHPWDLKIHCSEPAATILHKLTIKDPSGRHSSWEELLADISYARSNRMPNKSALDTHISTVKSPKTKLPSKKKKRQTRVHRIAEIVIYVLLGIFIALNIYLFKLITSG